jgi:hypothetical protein
MIDVDVLFLGNTNKLPCCQCIVTTGALLTTSNDNIIINRIY